MYPIPQTIHTNPALFYECRTYIELPVLSTIRLSYSNSGFSYHDAIRYGTGSRSDSLIIDLDNLGGKMVLEVLVHVPGDFLGFHKDVNYRERGLGGLVVDHVCVGDNRAIGADNRAGTGRSRGRSLF